MSKEGIHLEMAGRKTFEAPKSSCVLHAQRWTGGAKGERGLDQRKGGKTFGLK